MSDSTETVETLSPVQLKVVEYTTKMKPYLQMACIIGASAATGFFLCRVIDGKADDALQAITETVEEN